MQTTRSLVKCLALLSTTGAIALMVYLVIAVTQLRMRTQMEQNGVFPQFKMWLFPWLTWIVIFAILAVLGYMFISPNFRYETFLTLGVTTFILALSLIVTRKRITLKPWIINKNKDLNQI